MKDKQGVSEIQAWNRVADLVFEGAVEDLGRFDLNGLKRYEFAIGNRVFEILDTGDAADGTGEI